MQLLLVLLAAASVGRAAYFEALSEPTSMWCGAKITGNGQCESQQKASTYCCSPTQSGDFQNNLQVVGMAADASENQDCGNGGKVACA